MHNIMYTYTRGDTKIAGFIFLNGLLGFIHLQLQSPSKCSPFDPIHLFQRFSPLLETFLELFSADVVQDLQRFLFHFADISKTFPFHLIFHTIEPKKSRMAQGRVNREIKG